MITEAFLSSIADDAEFEEALSIVRKNSSSSIYVIGGRVYRGIVEKLYGTKMPPVDIDFIVKEKNNEIILPNGWEFKENRFGNPRFVNGSKSIDMVPLRNVYCIAANRLEPTIENFLSGTLLSVQAIAYDVDKKEVIGEVGKRSLREKKMWVNNLKRLEDDCEANGISKSEYVKNKADILNFRYVL